jgi:rhamnosyltransferase
MAEEGRAPAGASAGNRERMRVVGVLVSFDEGRDPMVTATAATALVDHVILVDNTPSGHPALRGVQPPSSVTVIANGNRHMLAGAYNAAIDRMDIHHRDADFVLFLDEDSQVEALEPFLESEATRACITRDDVAAVAPMYVDRATGLPGAHIQLGRFGYKVLPRDLAAPTEVSFLINSMSLWKRSVLRRIGRYNVGLALDHIDTDYCLRARALGYKLILNPGVRFWHSIGARRPFRLFGRTMQAGGHDPARREMIGRNTVLLVKRYGWRYPAFAALCFSRLVYEALGILLAERGKMRKTGALLKGAATGLFKSYRSG